ncbi:ATP-binding protein [Oenococcus sp. UCMA 17063]|nr:ATP-binding protein [Oenococcus sp. UCMA 17063]
MIRILSRDENQKKLSQSLSNLLKKHQAGLTEDLSVMRSAGSGGGYLETGNQFITEVRSKKKLSDLILSVDTRSLLKDTILALENREYLVEKGIRPIRKVLLNGKPGTVKTSIAQAISNELGLPLLIINVPTLFSSYLGDSGKNIYQVFENIQSRNAVAVFDEFDSIAIGRDTNNEIGEMRRIVNSLLTSLDKWSGQGVFFATTNDANNLDKAVWRRFDEHIEINLPQRPERQQLWNLYTRNNLSREELSFLANYSEGLSPADIELISEQSIRMQALVDSDIFEEAVRQVSMNIGNFDKKKAMISAIKKMFPNISTRDMANLTRISKSSVQRYIKAGE